MNKPKLYLSEGYSMKFDTASSMLHLVSNSDLTTHTKDWVKNNMGISARMVKCIANYSSATGLLKPKVYKPTDLGLIIAQNDPYLSDIGTLWLMHYIASSNPELIIWNRFFNTILHEMPDGCESSQFYRFYDDLLGTFTAATIKTNVPSELNSLINAYTEQQFSKLGLLAKMDNAVYAYRNQPIPGIIFYALILFYLERNFQGATTIDISFLAIEYNSPGRVCLFTPSTTRRIIEQLHREKWIQQETRADLDQVRFIHNHTFLDVVEMYYRGAYE